MSAVNVGLCVSAFTNITKGGAILRYKYQLSLIYPRDKIVL